MPTNLNGAQLRAALLLNTGSPVEALICPRGRVHLTTRLTAKGTTGEASHYVWEGDRWVAVL